MKDFLKKPTLYIIIIIILVILLLLKSCGPGGSGLFGGNFKDSTATKGDSTRFGKNINFKPKKTIVKTSKKSVTDKPKSISKNDLNAVSRFGAGVFLAAGDKGSAYLTGNGGMNWTTLSTGVTDDLHGSAVLNYNKMVLAGNNGKILRSVNMGQNWSVVPSTTNKDLTALNFSDTLNGFAVGKKGTVIRTADGGATWNSVTTGDTNTLNSVSVYGNTIWISGNNGALYKSTSGGANWTKTILSPAVNIYGISFDSLNYGIAVGDGGHVFETTNGGTAWMHTVSSPARKLLGVHTVSSRLAYIVGDGIVIRVDNGVKKYLLNDTTYHFTSVDPSPYLGGIFVGQGGIEGGVTVDACDNCAVKHDLVFYQTSETTWHVTLRVDASGTFGRALRIVVPGFQLDNSLLSGWTEMDNIQGSGNPRIGINRDRTVLQGNTSNPTQSLSLPDYADVDLEQYLNNNDQLSGQRPSSIQLNYTLTLNPLNSLLFQNGQYSGQFQYYFTDSRFDDNAALGGDFCHYITYDVIVP